LDGAEASVDPCTAAAARGDVIGCDYVAIGPSRLGAFPYACLALVLINPNSDPASV
jgi:hypothetical protein